MQDQSPSSAQPPQPIVQHVHHYYSGPNPGTAVVLELIPGIMFQTFGIGNLYTGKTGTGLLVMFGYWASLVLNVVLCFFLVGFITLPMTWVAFMIFAPILASNAAKQRAMGY